MQELRRSVTYMAKSIITIGREFGSYGLDIGKRVAEELGLKLYDKDM